MEKHEYKELTKKMAKKNSKWKNLFLAGFVGGLICLLGEIIVTIIESIFIISNKSAIIWMMIILVLVTVILTCLGVFDKLARKYQAGIIVPITGFAHSIASSILDYRKEGLIAGIGANAFKLAGSVIIYGIISAIILTLLKVALYG